MDSFLLIESPEHYPSFRHYTVS